MKNRKIIFYILFFIILFISSINVIADDDKINIKTISIFPHLVAFEDNVKVYDFPNIKTGKVIYILTLYEEVYASEKTIELFEVDGRLSSWIKITSPVVGWVFAPYLCQ